MTKTCALDRYSKLRGKEPAFVFNHFDGAPRTGHQLWVITSWTLNGLGLAGVKFRTHSFHIGAVSTAATMGYESAWIQQLGR